MSQSYKTRYFNQIKYVEKSNSLIKSSTNLEKILSEYKFYYALPEHIQRYFVQPYNYQLDNNKASYSVEKYFMPDVANSLINQTLSIESFTNLLARLNYFLDECPVVASGKANVYPNARYLVIDKTKSRLELLERTQSWTTSVYRQNLIEAKFDISTLLTRLEKAFEYYSNNRISWVKRLSHGDLCLSNILWSNEANLLKLIDPKGIESIYLDEYYDIAKLDHSLENYDAVVNGLYEIDFENLKVNFSEDYSKNLYDLFKDFVESRGINFELQRVYAASIFISMTPNHIEDVQRVAAFLLIASSILDSLGF